MVKTNVKYITKLAAVVALTLASTLPAFADDPFAPPVPNAPNPAITTPPPTVPPPRADMTVTDPILIGYRLGYTIYIPRYRILALDKHIEMLRDTSQAEASIAIPRLDRMASLTRYAERMGLQEAIGELKALDAPDGAYSDISHALGILDQPLYTAATAQASADRDPNTGQIVNQTDAPTVRILATLDEADAILPQTNGRLEIWLKLSHGSDALWGMHLGELAASLSSAQLSTADVAQLGIVPNIRDHEPSNCPPAVKQAIELLMAKMMKQQINEDVATQAANLIHSAYPDF